MIMLVLANCAVVYLCIKIYSMNSIFALPGRLDDVTNAYWEKRGLVILDWYFGEGMDNNIAVEKVKKERNDEISFKNYVYTQ